MNLTKGYPKAISLLACALLLGSCQNTHIASPLPAIEFAKQGSAEQFKKPIVYQVFTRLFGNTVNRNQAYGSKQENGVGKFNDFTDAALVAIKELGVTHIWYTGVLHHAQVTDYSRYGISNDDPDVVKGRAGSPYAIRDYYNVDPDLAVNPANRLAEFQALIARSHQHGLKVIIDIVPNHVARQYHSLNLPQGQTDFGATDDSSVEYHVDNNFYYIPNHAFAVPEPLDNYQPLGGEAHPLADGKFSEFPAKWTGNGSRKAKPHFYDWYETVKLNFGVRPDGQKDFASLPDSLRTASATEHLQFWQQQKVPNTWLKFRAITEFWLAQGVDGFRYDMAEMVPVEFWSYLNSFIKAKNPEATLIAEVYNPALYDDYIQLGKMDFLYDKVDFYDQLKMVMQNKAPADSLYDVLRRHQAQQHPGFERNPHLIQFLENHDEQRIASQPFLGDGHRAKPGVVAALLLNQGPFMLYFGQDVGEPGNETAGFGQPSRTSIFDYIGVPHHQQWLAGGKFDGSELADRDRELRDFYVRLLGMVNSTPALTGNTQLAYGSFDHEQVLAFYKTSQGGAKGMAVSQNVLVLANFSDQPQPVQIDLAKGRLAGKSSLTDLLYGSRIALSHNNLQLTLAPRQSLLLLPLEH